MAQLSPSLPARFPCWCRARYSWGGESKKDLRFREGDLIEFLNAGDGSWWMGRLRRDETAFELFPSNFVQVLDENFHPATQDSSSNPGSATTSLPTSDNSSQMLKTFHKSLESFATATSLKASFSPERQSSYQEHGPKHLSSLCESVFDGHKPFPAQPYHSQPTSNVLQEDEDDISSFPLDPPPVPPHRVVYNAPPNRATPPPTALIYGSSSVGSRGHSPIPTSLGSHRPRSEDAENDLMPTSYGMGMRLDKSSTSPGKEQLQINSCSLGDVAELRTTPDG